MKYSSTTKGYSLVEVLVAITILLLSIVGPLTIAAKSLQSAQYARQQNTAFFLAQEGITIANALRNDAGLAASLDSSVDGWAWTTDTALSSCFTSTGCNIDFRDSSLTSNVVSCATPANCALRFDNAAPRALYQMVSGDTTPYTRIIRFELTAAEEVLVTSSVSWSSTILGGTQEVVLTTSLFNLYD